VDLFLLEVFPDFGCEFVEQYPNPDIIYIGGIERQHLARKNGNGLAIMSGSGFRARIDNFTAGKHAREKRFSTSIASLNVAVNKVAGIDVAAQDGQHQLKADKAGIIGRPVSLRLRSIEGRPAGLVQCGNQIFRVLVRFTLGALVIIGYQPMGHLPHDVCQESYKGPCESGRAEEGVITA
jgi:hypothetical protein